MEKGLTVTRNYLKNHHEGIFWCHIQAEFEVTIQPGLYKNEGVSSKEELKVPESSDWLQYLQPAPPVQLPESTRKEDDYAYL